MCVHVLSAFVETWGWRSAVNHYCVFTIFSAEAPRNQTQRLPMFSQIPYWVDKRSWAGSLGCWHRIVNAIVRKMHFPSTFPTRWWIKCSTPKRMIQDHQEVQDGKKLATKYIYKSSITPELWIYCLIWVSLATMKPCYSQNNYFKGHCQMFSLNEQHDMRLPHSLNFTTQSLQQLEYLNVILLQRYKS